MTVCADDKNVLLITADQWRGDCLSTVGHPCVQTPNLDRLAGDGVLFKRHYTQCTPCGPARASLLTGMYLQNHRMVDNWVPLDARHTNVALEARKAGYHPVLFGYTDMSADPRGRHSNDPDLTTYEGVLPGMTPLLDMTAHQPIWRAHLIDRGYDEERVRNDVYRPRALPGGAGPTFAPSLYSDEDSDTAFVTKAAMRHIRMANKPWFVHVSYLRPHHPFVVPEPYHAMYDAQAAPEPNRLASPEEESRQHPYFADFFELEARKRYHFNEGPQPMQMSLTELRQLRATYYGMITHVDAWIGRLIDFLVEQGCYDSTLIIFTSDHGEMLGDHWQCNKSGYFAGAYHVPLVVRDPYAPDGCGTRVNRFTEHVDIMPTLIEWLGLDTPRQCDGYSLRPFLEDAPPDAWRTVAHYEHDYRHSVNAEWRTAHGLSRDECVLNVIHGERYKYVHFIGLPPLLFDLQEDPHEFSNLATHPDLNATLLGHAQEMLSWRMRNDERTLTGLKLSPNGVVDYDAN